MNQTPETKALLYIERERENNFDWHHHKFVKLHEAIYYSSYSSMQMINFVFLASKIYFHSMLLTALCNEQLPSTRKDLLNTKTGIAYRAW
jgi:hypothetical protein